jgi:hypothetical protein
VYIIHTLVHSVPVFITLGPCYFKYFNSRQEIKINAEVNEQIRVHKAQSIRIKYKLTSTHTTVVESVPLYL